MSKSRGNLVFVSKLRGAGVDPMVIRLALLADHYRAHRDWTDSSLAQAQRRLDIWRAQLSRPGGPDASQTIRQIRAALANDLDSPAALAAVDAWCSLPRSESDKSGEPGVVARAIDALLGITI